MTSLIQAETLDATHSRALKFGCRTEIGFATEPHGGAEEHDAGPKPLAAEYVAKHAPRENESELQRIHVTCNQENVSNEFKVLLRVSQVVLEPPQVLHINNSHCCLTRLLYMLQAVQSGIF